MKKLFVSLMCVVAVLAANADPVSRRAALQKARQFMPGKQFNAAPGFARSKKTMDTELFYIFNAEEGGFVVISGDDRTVPVIGYSEKGEINQDDMPDNLRNWLEGYVDQIQAIEDGYATPALSRSTRSTKPAVGPLLQTKWNQGYPYNLQAPTVEYTYQGITYYPICVTGCVATAIAQVMYYHQWPQSCPALDAYTTRTRQIDMPALPATTFEWNKMQLTYKGNETGDPANSVATLMRYVGQANEMNYDLASNGGSGAHIHKDKMINVFGYNRNMFTAYRYNYTTAEWENLVYQELAAGRPVLYSGTSHDVQSDEYGAHQFVCDGYDGNGLFHMNWGWGGSSDAFFVLSVANPHAKGTGGGTGNGGYIYNQSALIGFQPGSDSDPEIPYFESSTEICIEGTYSRGSRYADFENVSTQNCYFYAYYDNYVPTTTYPIEVGWALWQDNEVLDVLATKAMTIDNRNTQQGRSPGYSGPQSVSFGAGLDDGQYRLVQVWRPQGSNNDWTVISSISAVCVSISGNTLTVRRPNSYTVTYTVHDVSYSGDMSLGTDNTATVTLTNTCDATQEHLYFWVDDKLVGHNLGCVEPGKTGQVTVDFICGDAGTFDVKITSDANGNKVMWNGSLTISEAQETAIGGITYALYFGSRVAKVTGRTTTLTSLTIPATVEYSGKKFSVTTIGSEAFRESDITAISLPSTLKVIEPLAFYSCTELEEIDIPEGVLKVGHHAFAFCWGLKKVSLPSTLRIIENPAFYDIPGLQTVIVGMPTPLDIAPEVFYCWDRTLEEHYNSNATLYVPAGTKAAYRTAEGWDQFSVIFEGEPVETVINDITYSCVPGEGFADIIAADADALSDKDVTIPGSITVGGKTYRVRKICDDAFESISMNSLTIQPGVEEIGSDAFYYCYNIQKLVIPEGVKTIGRGAFRFCFDLKEISLPSTLVSIGDNAFYDCALTSVVSKRVNPSAINPNVFQVRNTVNGETVVEFTDATLFVPEGTKAKYKTTAGWNQFATIMQGEVKETTIADITYRYITGEGIADIVAANVDALSGKDVIIPGSITAGGKTYRVRKIEDDVFYQAEMKSLTIEPGIEEIGNYAFFNSEFEGTLTIPAGVKIIGDYAFRYCFYFETLNLPSTLTSIGDGAFGNWYYLSSVTSDIMVPFAIADNVFTPYSGKSLSNVTLSVPEGTKAKYKAANGWKLFTNITEHAVIIPGNGDANGDGQMTIIDATLVIQYVRTHTAPAHFNKANADVDGDGNITMSDAVAILGMILEGGL